MFKPSKVKNYEKITPKKAGKYASKAEIMPPTVEDIHKDIYSRSKRGYTWTYMLQVELNTIVQLKEEGWDIKITGRNEMNDGHMIRISW